MVRLGVGPMYSPARFPLRARSVPSVTLPVSGL